MLLVDKLNKGKLPEKPDSNEPAGAPGLSSLVVKPANITARIPNVEKIKKTVHERLITSLGMNSDTASADVIQRRVGGLVDEYCEQTRARRTKHDKDELPAILIHHARRRGA